MDSDKLKLFHHAAALLLVQQPDELFTSASDVKTEYRELAKIWHPDVNKDKTAGKVFTHINQLYDKALEKIKKGDKWEPLWFAYQRRFPFELGEAFIGDDHVTYLVDAKHEKYYKNFKSIVKDFSYASASMEKEVKRYLPAEAKFTEKNGKLVVTIPKSEDLFRLRDVLTHLNKMDVKHVAWVESSLYNLACYLNYTGIVHNDISLDTYFISPLYHSGALLGGWWYAVGDGDRLSTVPRRTFGLLPPDVVRTKKASVKTDLELIRAVGRELLGADIHKSPTPLQMWLKSASTDQPVEEYKAWTTVLKDSFGVRKFTKLDVSPEEIYS